MNANEVPNQPHLDDRFAEALESAQEQLAAKSSTDLCDENLVASLRANLSDSDERVSRAVPVLALLEKFKRATLDSGGASKSSDTQSPHKTISTDVQPAIAPASRTLGRFEIREQIGRGGYGIVLRAYDPELGRDVAIKIPRLEAALSAESRQRFLREAKATAALSHPAIVTVHETGSEDGVDYLVTELVVGDNLASTIAGGRRFAVDEAAKLVLTLADAVAQAHERGVLHRDIKPANVLLGLADQDVLKFADFGLTALVDEQGCTRTGALVGTPAYMAPEQASNTGSSVGPATDVYGLGGVLYHLLTGTPPFSGQTVVETVRAISEDEPILPPTFRPNCPRDLEAICLKCLQKNPAHRYTTAENLAADLQRFLAGEPVEAKAPLLMTRVVRWCQRRPLQTLLAAIVLSLAIVGPLVAVRQTQMGAAIVRAREDVRRTLYFSDMNLALRD